MQLVQGCKKQKLKQQLIFDNSFSFEKFFCIGDYSFVLEN